MNALLQILLSTSLIAFAPIFGRLGSTIIHPAVFSFYDILVAFIAFTIMIITTKPKMVKGCSRILVTSSLIFGFGVLMYYTALSVTSSVNVSFLGQIQLVFIILLGFLILKEKPSHQKVIGAVIVLIGGSLIIYQENINLSNGWIYAIIAFTLYSIVNIVFKILRNKGLDSKIILFFLNGLAAALLLSFIIISGIPLIVNYGLLFAVINGLIVDVAGWLLFVNALKRVELSKAFMLFSLTSLFTLIYSLIIFRTEVTLLQLLGGVLLIGGNIFANKRQEKFKEARDIAVS